MKLQLESIVSSRPVLERTLDRYTLLRVEPQNPSSLPLFWRLVDPTFNLVEVALSPGSGWLLKVVVPLYNGDIPEGDQILGDGIDRQQGFPCFHTNFWPEPGKWPPTGHYYTVEGRCRIWTSRNSLCISLFDDAIKEVIEPYPELWLLFNAQRELCGLTAPNLSEGERRGLAENVSLMRDQKARL